MLTEVDHIDLRVPDLAGAIAFFTNLGFVTARKSDPGRKSVELALPGSGQVIFEIREEPGCEKTYVHHIAFIVDDIAVESSVLAGIGTMLERDTEFVPQTGRTISNFRDTGGALWQLTD